MDGSAIVIDVDSPYGDSRFEFSANNVFYLPEHLLSDLRQPLPTRVIGTRGSGKTTLLRSLHWRDRVENESLRAALSGSPFSDRIVGVYSRAPRTKLQSLDRALRDAPDDVYASVTATYLELMWIESCALAVAGIADAIGQGISIRREREASDRVLALFAHVGPPRPEKVRGSLSAVSDTASGVRGTLERAAVGAGSWEALTPWATRGLLQVGNEAAKELCELLSSESGPWCVKACIDEGESLTDRQHRAFNSLMRVAEWPLFPTIAFLDSPPVGDDTLLPEVTLGRHDRNQILLDELSDHEFEGLCDGISRRRAVTLGVDPSLVDHSSLLGDLSINGLIEEALIGSVSPRAEMLRDEASSLAAAYPWLASNDEFAPYYQAYLIKRLNIDLSAADTDAERRRQESAELRKRMVASYLSICSEFKVDIRFASWPMLLQMSDKSVRDFIWQMHEIFVEVDKDVTSFFGSHPNVEQQTQALRAAAKKKSNRAEALLAVAPRSATLLIHGLGRLTARLQSEDSRLRNLKSNERGIFRVRLWKGEPRSDLFERIVSDAHDVGYLRLIDRTHDRIRFRVNASLAAYYGFSYRGAYYDTPLDMETVLRFMEAGHFDRVDQEVDAVWSQLQRGEDQPSLFEVR